MTTSLEFLLLLAGCTIVTLLPRILPFIFVRNFTISKPVEKWLSYIPICIFTGLIVENLLAKTNSGLAINWTVLAAAIPTCLIAIFTKSLLPTVLAGVFSMAFIRFFF
ncbi:AzlD domain-containing protein [Niallia sp. NCCP-28]|uniref:AzlD domain-containing protein n=1 Tax=Niallia sp. NCCP-28 TaxID=2934712 RepID=UPI00208D6C5C|nr:AzlD domain-containing protein [Niallia sp. NCCP-28]GKU84460.1 branched-chain amino acid ABC transporter [Niallia sp. NCCP-28]